MEAGPLGSPLSSRAPTSVLALASNMSETGSLARSLYFVFFGNILFFS